MKTIKIEESWVEKIFKKEKLVIVDDNGDYIKEIDVREVEKEITDSGFLELRKLTPLDKELYKEQIEELEKEIGGK